MEKRTYWRGGYMTGIAIHPTVPDLVYARTDVGGLYRWDASGKQWIPLFDWVSPDESNIYGIDGVAIDKNNPNVVYVAAGKYAAYSTSGI